ncbi:MAG TPA: sigma-70 family RNA polymerase sigma factor [Myxococcota bacterium]|jgi:RNA polymerase sigma-70 factor (ECF subfamily)|nr:sigma-70 family RNA polymerase sigma factor [Myxococcota bacterium]
MNRSATQLRSLTDLDLLAQVLTGDGKAWAEFVRRYRGLVYRCAGKVLARHRYYATTADIEEICANVWFQLWRDSMKKLRAYSPDRGSRLSSWIGLIAVNCAYDFLREVGRRPKCEELDPASSQFAYSPDPLSSLAHQEEMGSLRAILDDCSEREREFVDLYFARGLEPEQVASQMDISVKTVYSKKTKIRDKLLAMVGHGQGELPAAA